MITRAPQLLKFRHTVGPDPRDEYVDTSGEVAPYRNVAEFRFNV